MSCKHGGEATSAAPKQRNRPYLKPDPNTAPRFLSKRQVCTRLGLSHSTLGREVEAGRFPRPVRLTANRVAWRVADLVEWENSRREVA